MDLNNGVTMHTLNITRIYMALSCMFIFGWSNISLASCQDVPDNLISNCSFEIQGDDAAKALDWGTSRTGTSGTRIYSAADAADGQHYMQLSIPNELDAGEKDALSSKVPVPAHAHIELTAKMKATDILLCGQETFPGYSSTCKGWHAGRLTLRYFDSEQVSLGHVDANLSVGDLCANYDSGVCDWRQIHFTQTLPEGTVYARVEAKLSLAKGTLLVDDIVLRIKQEVPTVDAAAVRKPVLMPAPKNIQYLNRTLPITNIAIIGKQIATKAVNNLEEYLESNGFYPAIDPGEAELPNYDLVIDFGNSSNDAHISRLTQRYPSHSFEELGSQGYFLSITEGGAQNKLLISANTEQGHFYGVQTFKQLIEEQTSGNYFIHAVDVFDYPIISKRGMWMGGNWFGNVIRSSDAKDRKVAIQRLAELKLNGIWNLGNYINEYFNVKWRNTYSDIEVFSVAQTNSISDYLMDTDNNHITPHFTIRPYTSEKVFPDNLLTTIPINYSAPELDADTGLPLRSDDLTIIVEKLEWLLDLGAKSIGLDYNDFQNRQLDLLYYDDDISNYSDPSDPFGDVARAHLSFTNRVYNRIISDGYTDFNFRLIPMRYVRFGNSNERTDRYLQVIRELPEQIELHTAQYTQSDIDTLVAATAPISGNRRAQQLTNNYYAQGYDQEGKVYLSPFTPHMAWDSERLDGADFLPAPPTSEGDNTALIAWRTFADYTWNATDYNPVESFQRAAALYTGVTGSFTYPTITALSSNSAFTFEQLEITGTGFSTTAGTTSVIFSNGASVAADVISDTLIRFTIPLEAMPVDEPISTGPVTVLQDGLTVTSTGELTIQRDTDGDGDPDITDCADLDNAINHDAIEIIRDGIDQDCNGYDLTTEIISATYTDGTLKVRATNLPPGMNELTLVGFGAMRWRSKKGYWQYEGVTPSNPATVTVSSFEGVTLPFIVDQ